MVYKIIVGDNETTAHPLASIINKLPRERLTGALQRIFGQEYLASTFCRDIFAIIRRLPGGMRESVCGSSWADALRKAKTRWAWVTTTEGRHD